jgi:hypothetical protein
MASSTPPDRQQPFLRRFVTLRAVHSSEEVDLEIPGNRPVAELMPDLLKALGWPVPEGPDPLVYQLRTESGQILDGPETLDSAGIENADVLWIGIREAQGSEPVGDHPQELKPAAKPQDGLVPGLATVPTSHSSGQERRIEISPPVPASLKMEVPSLASSRGVVFELGAPPVLIGRKSRGSTPDIDLTEIDPEMASSRRHARILLRGDTYLVEPLPTTNGTFVNGRELKAGEIQPLKSGDRLLFGVDGVELAFLLAGETIPASFFRPG